MKAGGDWVTSGFSRAGLLRYGAAGGVTLLASGTALSVLAESVSAAPSDGDLAYLRLLIGTEVLTADFQTEALASGKLGKRSAEVVKRMRADERAHYEGLAKVLTDGGQIPATADDIDFAYPARTFGSAGAILKLASKLEMLSVGAYVGAAQTVQAPEIRLSIAQIAANEAQHVSALARALGQPLIGTAFAPALSIDDVSAALDIYES